MNAASISALAACAGVAIGAFFPVAGPASPAAGLSEPAPPKLSDRAGRQSGAKLAPTSRMQALAERAAELRRDEWPAFFRARLVSPTRARMAARLWAEADPAGFWAWLRGDFDELRFREFAPELMKIWAVGDPDAAMDAAAAITEKRLGDEMRREVIETVLDRDVEKGVELAARAGDFNRFSWGSRNWMKRDPEAAVLALASLPQVSDYRRFLKYAVPTWAEQDPAAAVEWMVAADSRTRRNWTQVEDWVKNGFAAAAAAQPATALNAVGKIADPRERAQAVAGVLSSGSVDPDTARALLRDVSPAAARMIARDMIQARPAETVADLTESAALLELLPSERNNLSGVEALARNWQKVDRESAWRWASSLEDPARRRRGLEELASGATPEEVAGLPLRFLSDQFFESALSGLPAKQRESWIDRLPAGHAAWANAIAD